MSIESVGKIPTRLKFSWGIGALGVAILMNSGSFLVLTYLITVVKLSPGLAGTVMLLTKIFDAISDPVMGQISDRSKFKSGRRRPFLFIGSFVSVIAFALLFTIPALESEWQRASYAFGVLMLYTIGYTIFNVPYMAMSAEMTDNYEERTSLHGVRVIFVSIGSSIVGAGAPLILQLLGKDWDAYAVVGLVLSAIIFAAMIACWLGTSDARMTEPTKIENSLFSQIGLVFQNRHFMLIALTKLLQLMGIMSYAAVFLIFFMDYLKINLGFLTIFGLVNTAATLAAVPVLTWIARSIGKRNTYIICAVITILTFLSWTLLPPAIDAKEAFIPLMLRAVGLGIVIAGNVMMAMSMLMDAIEYDALKTGMRREGLYAAFYSFVEKFAAAFGPFMVGMVLQFTGYDNSLKPGSAQSIEALNGIMMGVSYLPALFTGLSIIALLFYTLGKEELDALRAIPEPAE